MVEDFGPYRIVRKIAVGGMAEVYLARHQGLEGVERTVVLKRILSSYVHNPEFVTMFLDEARLMAALTHPNIAQVLDLGKAEDTYYLVMEHVRGPTLGALLSAAGRKRPLAEHEALTIALNIAQALDYVHGLHDELGRPLNIIHRDLNPANVLVSYTGAVKIIDFGIAKAATKVYETRTGVIKGTYGYMAPEQLTSATAIDQRADVFALGVLMYEMCVGQHPYDTSDEPNVIDRILDAKYKRPRQVVATFPRTLDRLISRCLAPHPEGRPDSVRSVISEIVAYMAQRNLVPTMLDVATLAHELVPDTEGAAPLKPLSASQVRRPPFRSEHSRTAQIAKLPDPDTELVEAPGLGEVLEYEGATVRVGVRHGYPHATHGEGPEDVPTQVAAFRSTASGAQADLAGPDPEAATALAVQMPAYAEPYDTTYELDALLDEPPPPAARRSGGARRALLGLGSVLLVVGVGVAAFVTARAIGGARRPGAESTFDTSAAPAADAPVATDGATAQRAPLLLGVLSEPPGAAISLDGDDTSRVTPSTLGIDAERTSVWIRVTLDGYVSQEREVATRAGEARFVLARLEVDAGAADAGEPGPQTKRRRVRPRRPRRRGAR